MFSDIKVENVEILKARQEDLQSNLGDIRFRLYGKISKSETYSEYKTIDEPDVIFEPAENTTLKKLEVSNSSDIFDGCFISIGYLLALIPILGLLFFFVSIGWLPTLIICGLFGLFWLFGKFSNTNSSRIITGGCLPGIFSGIFSGGIILVIAWALIAMAMRSCGGASGASSFQPPGPIVDQTENKSEEQVITNVKPKNDHEDDLDQKSISNSKEYENSPIIDTLIMHNRVWKDYRGDIHNIQLTVSKREIRTSRRLRDQIMFSNSFGEIYKKISIDNETFMNRIYNALDSLRTQKQMSQMVFAEAVVSMVQDIPYKLILDSDCNQGARESRFVKEYLDQCKDSCCFGNIKFGVQTPSEFMGNLYGDCDTRTLFLFTLLSHYNYDVGILNSEAMSHSMIAINLPYSGQFKFYNNKKYYVWETTNVDLVPGYIDPQYNAMHLWDMVLTSK